MPAPLPIRSPPICSPSGLFRMATWESELESRYERLPECYGTTTERHRQFLRWVEAEACTLGAHLARLLRPDTAPAVAGPLQALLDALEEDVLWARGRLERGLERAA